MSDVAQGEDLVVDRRRGILLYCLFPIAWIVSLSLKAPSDIANGQFLPSVATWENYARS